MRGSLQDVCEEAVERRKSSVQSGETGGCAVMARLENDGSISVALFPVKNSQKNAAETTDQSAHIRWGSLADPWG